MQQSTSSLGRPRRSQSSSSQASVASMRSRARQESSRPDLCAGDFKQCPHCTADAMCFDCCISRKDARRPSDSFLMQRLGRTPLRPERAATPNYPSKKQSAEQAAAKAEQEAKDEEVKQMKQARIRNWLMQKEAEMAARRRLEAEEENLLKQMQLLQEQRRDEHEAELQRQRELRLQSAHRRRKELEIEIEQGLPNSARGPRDRRASRSKVVVSNTIAAYATPRFDKKTPRAQSAGSRQRPLLF